MVYFHKSDESSPLIQHLKKEIETVDKFKIITGYTTESGLTQLIEKIGMEEFEDKIEYFLVGALTKDCADAFDLWNKSFTRRDIFWMGNKIVGNFDNDGIARGKPMIHAKLIVGIKDQLVKWAYVGSANVTDYALVDKNTEGNLFLHSDDTPKKVLDDILNYMDSTKKDNSRIYDGSLRTPIFRPTGPGEFTLEMYAPLLDVGQLYIAFVFTKMNEEEFNDESIKFIESDLIDGTGFEIKMRTIKKPIIFVFIRSSDFMETGDFFCRLGEITTSHDSISGGHFRGSHKNWYLYHRINYPPMLLESGPKHVSVDKITHVRFVLYDKIEDISDTMDWSKQVRDTIRNYIFSERDTFKWFIKRIYLKRKSFSKFITDPVPKTEELQVIDIQDIKLSKENLMSFEDLYNDAFKALKIPKFSYDNLIGRLATGKINQMNKNDLDEVIDRSIEQNKLNQIDKIEWTFRFTKIINRK